MLSRDEGLVEGPVAAKLVEELFVRQGVILDLTICGQTIHTTPEHPFYVRDHGWTPAGELQVGGLLATLDGRWLRFKQSLLTIRFQATLVIGS